MGWPRKTGTITGKRGGGRQGNTEGRSLKRKPTTAPGGNASPALHKASKSAAKLPGRCALPTKKALGQRCKLHRRRLSPPAFAAMTAPRHLSGTAGALR